MSKEKPVTAPIVKTKVLACNPEQAFEVFVSRISEWWPLSVHARPDAQGNPPVSCHIEPVAGGRVYQQWQDGQQQNWGQVLVFEQGSHLAFSWDMHGPDKPPTRVEVRFAADEHGTLMTLVHSGWETYGDGVSEIHEAYTTGWDLEVNSFGALCAKSGAADN